MLGGSAERERSGEDVKGDERESRAKDGCGVQLNTTRASRTDKTHAGSSGHAKPESRSKKATQGPTAHSTAATESDHFTALHLNQQQTSRQHNVSAATHIQTCTRTGAHDSTSRENGESAPMAPPQGRGSTVPVC